MIWYKQDDPEIVISTRIRLARNLKGVPFPNRLQDKEKVINKIKDAVFSSNSTLSDDFKDIHLSGLSANEKNRLAENHLISRQMTEPGVHECLINSDETMSLMIMEEDHIREQVILSGYRLDEAYGICDKVDDVLSESLEFAFDEDIGYLTACPTNVGTGLRASVMLHLPALSLTRRIDRIIESANNIGIAVRGYYGEGSKADGFFYQISNQITTGASESEIIDSVKNVTNQIIDLEKGARQQLEKEDKDRLEDKIYRSFGLLRYARKISSGEAISLLSDVLLGRNLGIIKEKGNMQPMELIVCSAPAHIDDGSMTPGQRDIKRAGLIRDNI